MGNSPLTVCISQAWEKQTVQVVLPAGQVMFMPHPVTVAMLMEAHPSHVVCQGSPSLLEQRLPIDRKLESGEIYYLLPSPHPVVTTTPTRPFFQKDSHNNRSIAAAAQQHHEPQYSISTALQTQLNAQQQLLKVGAYNSPPPPAALVLDKSTAPASPLSDYARLGLKPQRCLINLFVFRQSVASVMPEESFKLVSQSQGVMMQQQQHNNNNKPRALLPPPPPAAAALPPPLLINNQRYPSQFDSPSPPHHHPQKPQPQPRGARGRKQLAPWKPRLESISETKPVLHDVAAAAASFIMAIDSSKNSSYINNFSVSMISGTKVLPASPRPSPPSSPLHNFATARYSYGGGQQQYEQQRCGGGAIHGPHSGDRDINRRQRFIYSA